MMPLPYSLATGMKQPLQRIATEGSTYVLQTLGCPAFAEGNIIVLKDKRLGGGRGLQWPEHAARVLCSDHRDGPDDSSAIVGKVLTSP
jgi:hypothetical protein